MNADKSESDAAHGNQPAPGSDISPGPQPRPDPDRQDTHEGPGWMPAILAGTLLMGMLGFVLCGFTTWILYQKRPELALRTLQGSYIPEIAQSRLEPTEKRAVLAHLERLAGGLQRGDYEGWQAAGAMQRLVRLPVIQWGELRAVEAFLRKQNDSDSESGLLEISRLQHAIEIGDVTSIDLEDVLGPALVPDDSTLGRTLIDPLTEKVVREIVQRARLVADRSDVPHQRFDQVSIADLVSSEIESGLTEGGF